jgi:hypothetical protein
MSALVYEYAFDISTVVFPFMRLIGAEARS